jgi:CheY-like chemotaxis protein
MKRNGDIIIIEDDPDDWEILLEVFTQVMDLNKYTNRVVIIEDSTLVVDFLKESKTEPFLIISDINMPFLNGFELREKICADPKLGQRKTPYVFLTTGGSDPKYVDDAFKLSAQGFFVKPTSFNDYIKLVSEIVGYWKTSLIPQ